MSNRWSMKTQSLPRPKVCKSDPPPKKGITCEALPAEQTVELANPSDIRVTACNEALEPLDETTMTITPELSEVTLNDPPPNCDEDGGEIQTDNFDFLGTETVKIKVIFSDGSSCETSVKITWVE